MDTSEPFSFHSTWYSMLAISAGGMLGWHTRISVSPVDKFFDAVDKVREVMTLASVTGIQDDYT